MDATEELDTAVGGALVLGRYRLGTRLGSGGFGTVFAARDERLDRPVAVKAVPAPGPMPERAQREALAAARLDHPGIVAVFDVGEERGERFLISELVRGRTLAQLERDGALSDRDVLRVGLALADALEHAHERGVIHRDVKPQNVIVPFEPTRTHLTSSSGTGSAAKLLDFGVAHLAGDEPLTRTGDIVGTLVYMAPEQAAGQRVDERADLYSLALVLYEALAGTNPVRGASPAETARRVGTALPSLRRHRRDLPAALCLALDQALAPGPDDRGTLADLADALAEALPDVDDEGGTVAPHPLEEPRLPRLGRLGAGLAAGGLAAVALSAAELPAVAAIGVAVVVAALPRLGWLAAAVAALVVLPDDADRLAAALAAPPLLLWWRPLVWSVPAAAPLLALAGIAGAYPAVAGQFRGPWTRAALGAIGLWWWQLADSPLEHVAGSAVLLLAPVWGAAALVLPWLVAGRPLAADLVGAVVWAAGLAAGTAAVADAAGLAEPRGLAAGAAVAGAFALVAARARNTVNAQHDRA
jgi:hypothetical protein